MSRLNVMPRTIPTPELDDGDLAIIVVDNQGNHTINIMSRKTLDLAEPAASGHHLRHLISNLDNLT